VGALLRSNSYKTDPLSFGLPHNAIAGRYDLSNPGSRLYLPYGATDAKVLSAAQWRKSKFTNIVGGPAVTPECPIFAGFEPWSPHPHEAVVYGREFPWFSTKPSTVMGSS